MNKIRDIVIDILKHGFVGISIFIIIYIVLGISSGDIQGNSMSPYLNNLDSYFSIKRLATYNRCDVVIFKARKYDARFNNEDFIKRIIGLPNEKVAVANSKIYINDKLIDETNFLDNSAEVSENQTFILNHDEYFVLGDNRLDSNDSRSFGVVKREDLSKVLSRLGKEECLSVFESVTNISIKNTLTVAIISLAILIFVIFVSLYYPSLFKHKFGIKLLVSLIKILISTALLWFTILILLYTIVRILWFLKLTPAQNNWGNVNEIIKSQEMQFEKFDK